ncbi:MAG: M56 family metallopeptidase [Oscillospiraceae bacterium]
MAEWIVSSSVLIVILALLRFLLKGKISLRLQYALWALVLVRLLVPFSFGQTGISVMNAVTVKETEYYVWYTGNMGNMLPAEPAAGEQAALPAADAVAPGISVRPNTGEIPANTVGIMLDRILLSVWIASIVVTAVIFLFSNLRFTVHLRRSRQRVECEQTVLPVYVSCIVETPCLFGLLRPAIYVTPEVLGAGTALRHVLAHEATHYRHRDHIWALLRCVCLALHWYNPLVWWAASLSRRDGELACDEGAIQRIGEEERMEYGRTLIGLTCAKHGALLTAATTMTGSKRSIRERITLIAKKPKTLALALVIAVVVCLVAVGCTFTAAEGDGPWKWAKDLSSEDIEEAKIWIDRQYGAAYKEYSLSTDEMNNLAARINKLSKLDFRQNTELVGTMPEYGIIFKCGEEWYYINQCNDSNGTLEMGYGGNMWWIRDKKLYTVVSSLLTAYSEEKPDQSAS